MAFVASVTMVVVLVVDGVVLDYQRTIRVQASASLTNAHRFNPELFPGPWLQG